VDQQKLRQRTNNIGKLDFDLHQVDVTLARAIEPPTRDWQKTMALSDVYRYLYTASCNSECIGVAKLGSDGSVNPGIW